MKKYIILLAIMLIVGVGYFVLQQRNKTTNSESQKLINSVVYKCDKNKTIKAEYYEGPAVTQPKPNEPPIPTGSVKVLFDDEVTDYILKQTISADGARYANEDETLVFWSKGNSALIMRNNKMDLKYTNCVTN